MSADTNVAVDILARTIWGEARNEGTKGMEAVASVVLNRVAVAAAHNGYWWGRDVAGVCQKPFQFSCWNTNDPNREKLLAVTDRNIHFATALRIARRAVSGVLPDSTGGATHYHTLDILPHWAEGQMPCAVIGHHKFYRLEG
ncbi:MAG: cell wall hydrolase [Alphaproteobacteria bacterium]|nr:cell wall hydrolase [Alphaproteobacteria bacterium]